MNNEFGGCLPLERVHENKNPLSKYRNQTFNSGRSAILGAIQNYGVDKIWLPYYLCPTVKEFLIKRRITVREYFLTKEYIPIIEKISEDEMILWTNWYGCMKPSITKYIRQTYGDRLIFDNAQGLFEEPDTETYNCYYIYSCRKFLGVSDGAYLIQKHIKERENIHLQKFQGDWTYLESGMDMKASSQYVKYQINENKMKDCFSDMSNLTKEYLKMISWDNVKQKRKENFKILHDYLKKINLLDIDYSSNSPFMYPLFLCKDEIRSYLLEKDVFVPTWWKNLLGLGPSYQEYLWSKYIIPLPIDQRYGEKDMVEIAETVLKYEGK